MPRDVDMWNPPENNTDIDSVWEKYDDKYRTPEANNTIAEQALDGLNSFGRPESPVFNPLCNLIIKGLTNLDIEDWAKIAYHFDTAPSFDSFCESLEPAEDDGM